MRPQKFLSYGFFVVQAFLLLLATTATAGTVNTTVPPDQKANGNITLINLQYPDDTCTFPIETNLPIWIPLLCASVPDKMAIEVRNVPSATRIRLASDKPYSNPKPGEACTEEFANSGPPAVELLTIKEPTTLTEPLKLADLNTLPPGTVAKPGLKFITNGFSGQVATIINCLIIEVSPLSP